MLRRVHKRWWRNSARSNLRDTLFTNIYCSFPGLNKLPNSRWIFDKYTPKIISTYVEHGVSLVSFLAQYIFVNNVLRRLLFALFLHHRLCTLLNMGYSVLFKVSSLYSRHLSAGLMGILGIKLFCLRVGNLWGARSVLLACEQEALSGTSHQRLFVASFFYDFFHSLGFY